MPVRTTITIDDDIHAIARAQAKREHLPIGKVISQLARNGIGVQNAPLPRFVGCSSKFALLRARDEIITSEHVHRVQALAELTDG